MTQHAVTRPRGRPGQRGAAHRADPVRVGADQPEHLLGQPEPGRLPGARRVIDPRRGGRPDQGGDPPGHVHRPGGLPALVVHHLDRSRAARLADHRPDEAAAVRPVQPGGAQHVTPQPRLAQHGLLTSQLGPAVRGPRRGPAVFRVRLAGLAVEDVVGGQLDQRGAGRGALRGQARHCLPVDPERRGLVGLGGIDRGPRRAVDHHVRGPAVQGRLDLAGIGDVEVGAAQPGDRRTAPVEDGDEIPAEHPPGAGDQPPAHLAAAPGCLSGSHQSRWSMYQRTVLASPAANGVRGA